MSHLDQFICRKGTCSVKWNGHSRLGIPRDAIPLWVADMDFCIPPEVTEAICNRADHEIFGYSFPRKSYRESIVGWMKRRHNWDIDSQWIITVPGVVPAINIAINTFSDRDDAVMIQRPVYPPFTNSVLGNQRQLINNPLVLRENKYFIDFADFEQKIVENNVKIFVLCSPHNPVGRVWTEEELRQMGELCLKHDVLVVSDEIHQDLVFEGYRHIPFTAVDQRFEKNTIVCTAPSKTFNVAGLQAANVIIPDRKLREQFYASASCWGLAKVNTMGLAATEAAYQHGDKWLDEVLEYLQGNMEFVRDFLARRLPQVRLIEPEGLFLLWLDFRGLDISPQQQEELLVHKACLWLIQGHSFGQEGAGFARLNSACTRDLLKQAMEQLEQAIE